jgi:hypothetical protein
MLRQIVRSDRSLLRQPFGPSHRGFGDGCESHFKSQRVSARVAPLACLLLLMFALPSFAHTECTVSPTNMHVGDSGVMWLVYTTSAGSGRATITDTDVDFKATLAIVTVALLADKNIVVRFQPDGISCVGSTYQLIGVWLVK